MSQKLDPYFNEVERYSEEHIKDIDKLNRLLESLSGSVKDTKDSRIVAGLKQTIDGFNSFLQKNKLQLSNYEKKEIMAITGASLELPIKKRMVEDLFHKIKNRFNQDKINRQEKAQYKKDVLEFQQRQKSFLRWFYLFMFSLEFGTITLFSHQLKESMVRHLLSREVIWKNHLYKHIIAVLNEKYYILSTVEYNSLELILQVADSMKSFESIPTQISYGGPDLKEAIEKFAILYITLLKNRNHIKAAAKKAFDNKMPHNFWGALLDMLDEPIVNGRPLLLNDIEKMNQTILGVLYSFYSVYERSVVKSINQLLYLLNNECVIDKTTKRLTKNAKLNEEKNRKIKSTKEKSYQNKFDEIDRILNMLIPHGKDLSEKILMGQNKSINNDADEVRRPFINIKRLIEGYISYFIDLIDNEDSFILEYDGKDYSNFFDVKPEIIDAVSRYNLFDMELEGARLKKLFNITIETDVDSFLSHLSDSNVKESSLVPSYQHAKAVIGKISEKTYYISQRLVDILSSYYNKQKIVGEKAIDNYDFFINAFIKKNKGVKAAILLGKDIMTLKDFLTGAAAFGLYISQYLKHPGIDGLKKEFLILKEKINSENLNISTDAKFKEDSVDSEDISIKLDAMYKDTLTGLWKGEYLEEVIIPQYYENLYYMKDTPRFIVNFTIDNLQIINDSYGPEITDLVIVETIRRIKEHVHGPGRDSENIILRITGGELYAYIQNESLTSIIEMLQNLVRDVAKISVEHEGTNFSKIPFYAAAYEEHERTSVYENIEVVRQILWITKNITKGSIGCIKDMNKIILKRDFNRHGELNPELITVFN